MTWIMWHLYYSILDEELSRLLMPFFIFAVRFVTCSYATERDIILFPSENRYLIALITFSPPLVIFSLLSKYPRVRSECSHRLTSCLSVLYCYDCY